MKIPNLKKILFLITALSIIECVSIGFIGFWREPFWNAVQSRNVYLFWSYLGYFSLAALLACFTNGYNTYLQKYAALVYRTKLTRKALKIQNSSIEGLGQRIQEDCFNYPLIIIGLVVNGFKNTVIVGVYLYILLVKLSAIYLIFPILYIIISTMIASKISSPLISLNYINQAFEAKFRQILTKFQYGKVYRNNMKLFKTTKFLNYFQSFYNQITVIIPYIILWSTYSVGKISFGVFMQCSSAMNEVISSLSGIINNFEDINKLRSCSRRLKELGVINARSL